MSVITIDNLKVFAYHGVLPEETEHGQDFFLTAKLHLNTENAAKTDDLNASVDYGEVCSFLAEHMKKNTFQLIEAAADNLATELLIRYPLLDLVELTLKKPNAPIPLPFENVSITVQRGWHDSYLSIGSNLGNRREYLDTAIEMLKQTRGCQILKVSSYITTKPYGYVEQSDFLNGAVKLRTFLSPYELLDLIHLLEQQAGRKREIHWGPRTLDIDIIFYDDLILSDESLTIPHPDMENRQFVLAPLKEIAPYKIHPLLRKRIKDMEI